MERLSENIKSFDLVVSFHNSTALIGALSLFIIMIRTGRDVEVFHVEGFQIARLGFGDGEVTPEARRKRELMAENYISVFFNWAELKPDYFDRGCYIETALPEGIFRLRDKPKNPTYNPNTGGFQYELKFEAFEMFWQDFVLFYTFQGLQEAEWALTGTATQFLQIAVECINKQFGVEYSVGQVDSSEILNLSFDSQNIFDGLTEIAEKFGLEWYVDYQAKTLNLVASYEYGDHIRLERERQITDITVSNENNEDYCTRLYAFGSTRNIPSNYRTTGENETVDAIVQKRLRMPAEFGDRIDAKPNLRASEVIEKVKVFEDIYPKRVGTITEIREVITKNEEGTEMTVFYFKDSGLEFDEKWILPGQTLMLSFSSGWMQGRDSELAYHSGSNEFEIINNQDNPDQIIPNNILKPRIGDQYVLYNFDISMVGELYVPEAEQELKEEAEKWMQSMLEDNATYNCAMNPMSIREGYEFEIGQRVELVSLMFKNGSKKSRIRAYEMDLYGTEAIYAIGDKPRYSRLKTIEKTVSTNKEITDMQFLEAMKAAKGNARTLKALNYLRIALENNTSIEGGLILTTLIKLGMMVGGEWVEQAGISGITEADGNDVAFWAGGSLDDAINNLAAIILRMDGSGQLAKGNILWNALGELIMRGKFETNTEGTRIVIDPETKDIQFYYEDTLAGRLYVEINDINKPYLIFETQNAGHKIAITPEGMYFYNNDENTGGIIFSPTGGFQPVGNLPLDGTSPALLPTGWYMDGDGFVKIRKIP